MTDKSDKKISNLMAATGKTPATTAPATTNKLPQTTTPTKVPQGTLPTSNKLPQTTMPASSKLPQTTPTKMPQSTQAPGGNKLPQTTQLGQGSKQPLVKKPTTTPKTTTALQNPMKKPVEQPEKTKQLGKRDTLTVKRDSMPVKKDQTPVKKDLAPVKKDSIPQKKETAPAQKEMSQKKDTSPKKEATSPKKDMSPTRKDTSPTRRDTSPTKDVTYNTQPKVPQKKANETPRGSFQQVTRNTVTVPSSKMPSLTQETKQKTEQTKKERTTIKPQEKVSPQKITRPQQITKLEIDTKPLTGQQTEKYDLSEIPEHMRDDIKDLIERKVEERVLHEMEYLRAEAHQALEFTRIQSYQNGPKGGKQAYADWVFYHGQHHPYQGYAQQHPHYHNNYYGGGYGYYGQNYGQTVQVPKSEEDEFLYSIATSAKMRTRSPVVGKRSQMLNYTTDKTVEFQIDSPKGPRSKEYVLQRVTKGEEALTRRKAYDAHLKTDIMLSGRDKSMNKTYDPYYHPYWAAPPVNNANQMYPYGPYKAKDQSGVQSDTYQSPSESSPHKK